MSFNGLSITHLSIINVQEMYVGIDKMYINIYCMAILFIIVYNAFLWFIDSTVIDSKLSKLFNNILSHK